MSILTVETLSPALRATYDNLPDDLKPYVLSLPPRISMKRATALASCSRGYLYAKAAEGKVKILKAGTSQNSFIVIETISLLKLMAAMQPAAIKPRRKTSKPVDLPAPDRADTAIEPSFKGGQRWTSR
jgi:predicted aminopeptidase